MNFDEIVASISFDEFKTFFLRGKAAYLQREVHNHPKDAKQIQDELNKIDLDLAVVPKKVKQTLANKANDTLVNIAYFARAISQMHPGWEEEGFKTDEFRQAVEKLYAEQSVLLPAKQLKGDALLTEFFRITVTTLQDNHLNVLNCQGIWPFKDKGKTIASWGKLKANHPEGSVGKNSAFEAERLRSEGWDVLSERLSSGGKELPLMIAQKSDKGKTIGIVAFSTCFAPYPTKNEQWKRVLDQFKKQYSKWDKVILDFRGNTGGDGYQTREVAQTLCGNEVPYCMESRPRQTDEAQLRDESFAPIKGQPRWEKRSFKGTKKRVYVLTDKETGSAAEAIVPMMKDYPGVQFIGENTCGCCQYGAVKPVPLPCGGAIQMGSVYREYEDGLVECVGHRPDVNCSGMDALQVALAPLPRVYVASKRGQENTSQKEKRIFPKWLKNPPWLWQGRK